MDLDDRLLLVPNKIELSFHHVLFRLSLRNHVLLDVYPKMPHRANVKVNMRRAQNPILISRTRLIGHPRDAMILCIT